MKSSNWPVNVRRSQWKFFENRGGVSLGTDRMPRARYPKRRAQDGSASQYEQAAFTSLGFVFYFEILMKLKKQN